MFSGQQFMKDPMANMAMQYGQNLAGQGKDMVHQQVSIGHLYRPGWFHMHVDFSVASWVIISRLRIIILIHIQIILSKRTSFEQFCFCHMQGCKFSESQLISEVLTKSYFVLMNYSRL